MKYFEWDAVKNSKLRDERGVCFDDVLAAIEAGRTLDRIEHPNQKRYPGQQILVVNINDYVFLVPYVEDKEKLLLKTIYPSRKFTKVYIQDRRNK